MTIVLLLIPLAFILVAFAAAALFWAVDSGQYDDLEEAANAPLEADPGTAEDHPPPTDSDAGSRQHTK